MKPLLFTLNNKALLNKPLNNFKNEIACNDYRTIPANNGLLLQKRIHNLVKRGQHCNQPYCYLLNDSGWSWVLRSCRLL